MGGKGNREILTGAFISILIFPLTLHGSTMEGKIIKHVLQNYDRTLRPVKNHDTVLNLTLNMKIWQVMSVDEKHQKITIQNYFQMKWINEMLRWNHTEFGNITKIPMTPEQVWIPDIVLLNCADGQGDVIQKHTDVVSVEYTGACYWYPKVMMTASFTAHTKYFPYDSQNFSFRFESWSLPVSKFRILPDNQTMIDEHYHHSSQWNLIGQSKVVSVQNYNGDTYSDMNFTFRFSRKPSYYITTLILPCVILLSIVLFSYFLPASSGERMSVVVTALLGFAVFLEVVSDSLPQNSNSTSILSVYILATMFECALSFFVTCFVITLIHKTHNTNDLKPPPAFLRKYFQLTVKDKTSNKVSNYEERGGANHKGSLTQPEGNISDCVADGENEVEMIRNFRKWSLDSNAVRKRGNCVDFAQSKHLREISQNLSEMTSSMKKEQDDSDIQIEWVRLSQYIDWISFWAFLFLSVLSISILFIGFYVRKD